MGNRRFALLLATGSACLVALASPAAAQDDIEMEGDAAPADAPPPADGPAKDPAVAKKWLQAAATLMHKGDQLTKQGKAADAKTNYENAVTAYQKAIESSDDVAIHAQLAAAQEKAGDPAGAMKSLKVVVAAQGLRADVVKKAQTKLDELSMKVGVVTLTIVPDGTSVTLGGKQIGEAPLAEPLVLAPGTHVVTFAAVGYQPKDLELKIEEGSESERTIKLEPVPMGTKAPVDDGGGGDAVPIPLGPTKPDMRPLYIGAGATAGLLLIGTITGIVAVSKHGQYNDSTSPTERAALADSGETYALVTDLCLLGALGAAAFTAYWYQYKYRPAAKALEERQVVRHPKVDVVPWVQSDAGGIVAVGSF